MYNGPIEWEETESTSTILKGTSHWGTWSDVGAHYGISCKFRTAFAHFGDENGNFSVQGRPSCLDDMYELIDGFRESIPILGYEGHRYPVFNEVYDPYWSPEYGAWVFETDTDWIIGFSEGFKVSREYNHHFEYIGQDVPSFESAENIVRNDWDTFYC